jgi:S-adenosylmethionine synthetase
MVRKMRIFIEKIKDPVEKREVEFVESKGVGHPDSICDSVCEACGEALASYYKKHFGTVLHYNIDKALLVAGAARPRFGGGKITSPVKLTIAGRATDSFEGKKIPAKQIILDTAKRYLSQFNKARFDVIVDIKSGAANLTQITKKKKAVANDTSFGASHWPLSKTEQLVLDACNHISSPQFRRKFPAAGQDIKVMGVRMKDKIELTVAIAFIGKHIKDMQDYITTKNRIIKHLIGMFEVNVDVNTLDDVTGNADSVYITVSGLSAEMGDDGQVGRGNRYNGLITPSRPMSIEAVAGKNILHPGRSYQIAAYEIAKELVRKGAKSAEVQLVTNIGAPLAEPKVASIKTEGSIKRKEAEQAVRRKITEITQN